MTLTQRQKLIDAMAIMLINRPSIEAAPYHNDDLTRLARAAIDDDLAPHDAACELCSEIRKAGFREVNDGHYEIFVDAAQELAE